MLAGNSFKKKYLITLFILILTLMQSAEAKDKNQLYSFSSVQQAISPDESASRLIFGISYFNVFRDKKNAFEGRVEYRSSLEFFSLQPFAGLSFTSSGAYYGMAGIFSDISLDDNLIFTPSFGAGYFNKGFGLDLAYELEFRTMFEISYILQNDSRIGFGFYHISNGNLGRSNPGAENFTFLFSLPIN